MFTLLLFLTVYVPEDFKPNTWFMSVDATDTDLGDNAKVDLTLRPSSPDPTANVLHLETLATSVGKTMANLRFNSTLDREKRSEYRVTVQACDKGKDKK